MATKFAKGQDVKLAAVVPQGPVKALRMDEDGNFFYLVGWTDADGNEQSKYFREGEIAVA